MPSNIIISNSNFLESKIRDSMCPFTYSDKVVTTFQRRESPRYAACIVGYRALIKDF
jgi:hypothetical protein